MAKKAVVTPAIRWLRANNVPFEVHTFDYVEKGGTRNSSSSLGVSEHAVVKTLIARGDERHPLCVLMHGDLKMSTKELARQLGFKNIAMCAPDDAQRLTGYMVGGTSPFGMRTPMPVHVETTILELPRIFINGGGRGLLVEIEPTILVDLVGAVVVECGRSA